MENIKEKEKLSIISNSIASRWNEEVSKYIPNKAVGRVSALSENKQKRFWITNKEDKGTHSNQKDFTDAIIGTVEGSVPYTLKNGIYDISVYKNLVFGQLLCAHSSGIYLYRSPSGEQSVELFNKSTYNPLGSEVKDISIQYADDESPQFFPRWEDLSKEIQEIYQSLEGKRQEIEQIKQDDENTHKEDVLRQKELEMKDLEESLQLSMNLKNAGRSFIRQGYELRSQFILDPIQEEVKRSHILDRIPILIEGGPGTGKTTTLIQRLRFLTDEEVFKDYVKHNQLTKLSRHVESILFDKNKDWMFFSPTPLLKSYLQANMDAENLGGAGTKTKVWLDFQSKMIQEYNLYNVDSQGPFKRIPKKDCTEVLFKTKKIENIVSSFDKFFISQICVKLKDICKIKTSQFSWNLTAVRVKYYCNEASNCTKLIDLINYFFEIKDKEREAAQALEIELSEKLKDLALNIQVDISKDIDIFKKLDEILYQWYEEAEMGGKVESDDDDEGNSDIEAEEELNIFNKYDFKQLLNNRLKSIIRSLGLQPYDAKSKLSKRNQEIYDVISPYLKERDYQQIGQLAYFTKYFSGVTRGVENNIFAKLPQVYKAYRKQLVASNTRLFNKKILKKLVAKDNKLLHTEEQSMLLGYINNMLHFIIRKSKTNYKTLKHSYVSAFEANIRPIIGIDEATDFSVIDYYAISSFAHYEISCITLSGDLMQGIADNGISHWNDLDKIFPKLERYSLNKSYRQTQTLLEVASRMYEDTIGELPAYKSDKVKGVNEPTPLLFISQDEDEKAEWIIKRIREISRVYDGKLPSTAIFLEDEKKIPAFIERLEDLDSGLKFFNGKEKNEARTDQDEVRIYPLEKVKGLEFEVAFFHNIDSLQRSNKNLIKRFLYVGLSRASSFLGATMSVAFENEDVIKYFDISKKNWKN